VSFINFQEKKIVCKVVYAGPDGSGKTATLRAIYARTRGPDQAADLEPPSPGPHYDYLPLQLGEIRGFTTHFELFSVPPGAGEREVRRQILEKVDGVIFVADARPNQSAENKAALEELEALLRGHGMAIERIPFVVQLNKMDLLGEGHTQDLSLWISPKLSGAPLFPSIAANGIGVFEALKELAKKILMELRKQ
jgi:signal recognition particle receptor subunit beta